MSYSCIVLANENVAVHEGLPRICTRGAVLEAAKWANNAVISICFLDGVSSLHERVKACAEMWRSGAGDIGPRLEWRKKSNTNIRISFLQRGSWSLLGTQCRGYTNENEPTMNFGWLTPGSTDLEVQEVVLHEFGHALGYVHEHQHPDLAIKWNEQAVFDELSGPPNNWSREKIKRNVFEGYVRSHDPTDPRKVVANDFDEHSIMLYPVKKSWTLDGYETKTNTKLSNGDIELYKKIYG